MQAIHYLISTVFYEVLCKNIIEEFDLSLNT